MREKMRDVQKRQARYYSTTAHDLPTFDLRTGEIALAQLNK